MEKEQRMDTASRARTAAESLGDGPVELLREMIARQRYGEDAVQACFAAACEAASGFFAEASCGLLLLRACCRCCRAGHKLQIHCERR